MTEPRPAAQAVPLRAPDLVMRLDRLGASHPTRLSFLRALLRRIARERWTVARTVWSLDRDGFGHAVYAVRTPARTYSLVAFSNPLAPEARTDRVIAEAWDTAYVLYDGLPDAVEIARLSTNAPRQEAGRFRATDLILSRANKSVRLFDEVVAALAGGRQPDAAMIDSVGYLMRTTAVYGNGKFGIADRDVIADRPEFSAPFQAEMLTVWLIRAFTVDLAEHCARALSPAAVPLDRALRRRLGVGNSTGLGMAPFLVRHPVLLHRWIAARETALARVRSLARAGEREWQAFLAALEAARDLVRTWRTDDPVQAPRVAALSDDLARFAETAGRLWAAGQARLWDRLYLWAEENLSLEGQEMAAALLMEPHGALVDDLCDMMAADEDARFGLDGAMTCGALRGLVHNHYGWALALPYEEPAHCARFWYVSEEKLEPRLGERHREPGAEREQPLGVGRDVAALAHALRAVPEGLSVAAFALGHPEHRGAIRRVQLAPDHAYAELRDNLIGAALRPVDLLRCKLAFFGATRFDPRSDRWLRISLFQGAPFPDEISGRSEAAGLAKRAG